MIITVGWGCEPEVILFMGGLLLFWICYEVCWWVCGGLGCLYVGVVGRVRCLCCYEFNACLGCSLDLGLPRFLVCVVCIVMIVFLSCF